MTYYGYQSGGTFGNNKQALGFDASASERMRVDAAMKERQRVEKERAKAQLADVTRKYEHNKTEISHKEAEIRRLTAEASHMIHELDQVVHQAKDLEEKEHASRKKASDVEVQVQNHLKEQVFKKKDDELVHKNLEHVEREIEKLEQQAGNYKRIIADEIALAQRLTLEVKKLEAEVSGHQADAERSKSQRLYILKDADNKKHQVDSMQQRRVNEASEVQRLKSENARLEIEIKRLEAAAKQGDFTRLN